MAGNYRPSKGGIREISLSPWMKQTMLDAGRNLAGNANAVGDSKYEAKSIRVRAGWANESRHGASVAETDANWRDWRDAVLLRVASAMATRGGRRR